jgi:putative membrane protein
MYVLRRNLVAVFVVAASFVVSAQQGLNDLEMAHVAVTASNIDIAYAHLALALSDNPDVRGFAERMIRDHSNVNGQVAALAGKLGLTAQDNAMSRKLLRDSARIKDEMSRLRGAEFDRYYANNEWQYHQTVNSVVADTFIPTVGNAEVKQAFEGALVIFRGHERHAEQLVRRIGGSHE